jgi:two-component system, NarL family, nitrate/nitrite response regulator NarL
MGSSTLGTPTTVSIVEDIDVVAAGVRCWIAEDPEQRATVVAVGDSIEAVLGGPGRHADVLVLDLELGKRMVTDRVAELSDLGLRVVVFSVHVKPLIVQAVLDAGACAFLDKHTERAHFIDTVVAAGRDSPYVTPSMAGGMLNAARLAAREREALLYLFQGMSHASIAARMNIKPVTVKEYVERTRAKFAASGRPCRSNFALLARCIEYGLIRAEDVAEYRSAAAGQ